LDCFQIRNGEGVVQNREVDAQFSMPFVAAVAVFYRRAGLEEFHLSKIRSEEVERMMRRVECVVEPQLERTFPKQWPATAEI
jgi:2-methylcitrate dehydratase PrpD